MAEAKTKPTSESVKQYLSKIEDAERRNDCETLLRLMGKVTGHEAVMWGTSIVGFGKYQYKYESGRSGESCATGFASRKSDISVYLVSESAAQSPLLKKLGKHKMGKACLSIKRLADVDLGVLETLVATSFAEVKKRHSVE